MSTVVIKLQTSTIEIPVKAQDGVNESSEIKVGFKRLKRKEAKALIEQLGEVLKTENEEELDKTLINNIIYIKDFELFNETETGQLKSLHKIVDTRKEVKFENLWEDATGALKFSLEMLLESEPWRFSLILAFQQALLNKDLSGLNIKN